MPSASLISSELSISFGTTVVCSSISVRKRNQSAIIRLSEPDMGVNFGSSTSMMLSPSMMRSGCPSSVSM
ncbi:MAG: hypothetical protein IK131_12785 [Paludibacteraceae bacterium]|nr:hypothetical protein [Paludibacteraceae bacterium]